MLIYKIVDKDNNCVYVGSTKNTLVRRKNLHKDKAKLYPQRKLYHHIMENGGWDNFTFVEIEKCEGNLIQRERYYCDILQPPCNTYRPIVSKEEDLENRRHRAREYYWNNPEEHRLHNNERRRTEEGKEKRRIYLQNKKQNATID